MSQDTWTAHCTATAEQVYEMNRQLGESGCQICGHRADLHPSSEPKPSSAKTYREHASAYARGGAAIVAGFTRGGGS